MVSPRRVVRGLGATPKRRSAGLLMARCWEPKSEVGVARRFRERDSGVGFTGGKLCLTVSALWVMLNQGSPLWRNGNGRIAEWHEGIVDWPSGWSTDWKHALRRYAARRAAAPAGRWRARCEAARPTRTSRRL